jgi:hypothetical protein
MKEEEMREGRSASVCRKYRILAFIPALVHVCCLLLVLSCGCLDTLWNMTPDLEDGTVPSIPVSPVPSPSPAPSAGEQPAPVGTAPVDTFSAPVAVPEGTDNVDAMGDGETDEPGDTVSTGSSGSFSLAYMPPDGYVAEEGEMLEMQVKVVPDDEFSAPVSLRMDIAVPSPGLPFLTLWRASYDLGTTFPPYPPVTWSLALNPDSPPEEYGWVTGVARHAKGFGITSFSVNVRVTAEGSGQTVSESPSYMVRLS